MNGFGLVPVCPLHYTSKLVSEWKWVYRWQGETRWDNWMRACFYTRRTRFGRGHSVARYVYWHTLLTRSVSFYYNRSTCLLICGTVEIYKYAFTLYMQLTRIKAIIFSRVLCDSIHYCSVRQSIHPSVRHKVLWKAFAFLIWKKVEDYLRLFETYGGNRFSLFLMSDLGKLAIFWGRMPLRMKLIAQKELIFLFQMTPNRILWDQ